MPRTYVRTLTEQVVDNVCGACVSLAQCSSCEDIELFRSALVIHPAVGRSARDVRVSAVIGGLSEIQSPPNNMCSCAR